MTLNVCLWMFSQINVIKIYTFCKNSSSDHWSFLFSLAKNKRTLQNTGSVSCVIFQFSWCFPLVKGNKWLIYSFGFCLVFFFGCYCKIWTHLRAHPSYLTSNLLPFCLPLLHPLLLASSSEAECHFKHV